MGPILGNRGFRVLDWFPEFDLLLDALVTLFDVVLVDSLLFSLLLSSSV